MERIKQISFFKIHDIWFDTKRYEESKSNISALHTNDDITSKFNFKIVQKTFLLDISKEKEEIFKKFDYKSARYAINRAIRDEVTVKKIESNEEIEQYLEFQKEFCIQKGIPMMNPDEMDSMICYYALSKDGEYLGACAFIYSEEEQIVRYKYGATKHKLNANEIILWRAICDFHDAGYKYFDFGGVVPTEDKESYYYRHYQFKKKFGGELIDSYIYIKVRGILRVPAACVMGVVNVFFHGDFNKFTNSLNKLKLIG